VVENLDGDAPKVHPIRDPARRITEFRFDEGWTQAAEAAKVQKRRSILDVTPSQKASPSNDGEGAESVTET
jgi:ribosome-binding protein aMBF1 (putative translation factor)